MKTFVLCADDFGQSHAISTGILSLVEKNRLSAVSAMANMSTWKDMAKPLQSYKDQIDIGLHFNLTDGSPLTKEASIYFGDLNRLILKSFTGKIDQKIVENEIKAQLDRFSEQIGASPDFIDGHQHVHHLPVIRDALLHVYQERFKSLRKKPYIRVSSNPLLKTLRQSLHYPKTLIISLTGALKFKRQLELYEIPHNQSFSGIYSFNPKNDYRQEFKRFLKEIDDQGLIMCHPGFQDEKQKDVIYRTRTIELDYLSSSFFLEDTAELKLTRFRESQQQTRILL